MFCLIRKSVLRNHLKPAVAFSDTNLVSVALGSSKAALKTEENLSYQKEEDDNKTVKPLEEDKSTVQLISSNQNPSFPSLIHEHKSKMSLSERLESKYDKIFTKSGRFLRVMFSPEVAGNMWENAMEHRKKCIEQSNLADVEVREADSELSVAKLVQKLGGALKLVGSDRWVDDITKLRARNKMDVRNLGSLKIDALDFRGSGLSHAGMKFLKNLVHIRYLNVGDCKEFDDICMTKLNVLCESLEYLDISGTKVTPEGLTYLRLFPNLKWINVSRTCQKVYDVVPFILEVLPPGCTVVVDDEQEALSYGTEIPFTHHWSSNKDHVYDEDPGIGNMTLFEDRYGQEVFNPADVTHVHQLWKTPLATENRKAKISMSNIDKQTLKMSMLRYYLKAEKYPPLF